MEEAHIKAKEIIEYYLQDMEFKNQSFLRKAKDLALKDVEAKMKKCTSLNDILYWDSVMLYINQYK
jgi:hypothetical protein